MFRNDGTLCSKNNDDTDGKTNDRGIKYADSDTF